MNLNTHIADFFNGNHKSTNIALSYKQLQQKNIIKKQSINDTNWYKLRELIQKPLYYYCQTQAVKSRRKKGVDRSEVGVLEKHLNDLCKGYGIERLEKTKENFIYDKALIESYAWEIKKHFKPIKLSNLIPPSTKVFRVILEDCKSSCSKNPSYPCINKFCDIEQLCNNKKSCKKSDTKKSGMAITRNQSKLATPSRSSTKHVNDSPSAANETIRRSTRIKKAIKRLDCSPDQYKSVKSATGIKKSIGSKAVQLARKTSTSLVPEINASSRKTTKRNTSKRIIKPKTSASTKKTKSAKVTRTVPKHCPFAERLAASKSSIINESNNMENNGNLKHLDSSMHNRNIKSIKIKISKDINTNSAPLAERSNVSSNNNKQDIRASKDGIKSKKKVTDENSEPIVTAGRGTLKHLKQKEKRQEFILQQQLKDLPQDYYDETDAFANFKGKKKMARLYLDSPTVSNASASFNSPSMVEESCSDMDSLYAPAKGRGRPRKLLRAPEGYDALTPRTALYAKIADYNSAVTPLTSKNDTETDSSFTPVIAIGTSDVNRIIYNNKLKRQPKRQMQQSPIHSAEKRSKEPAPPPVPVEYSPLAGKENKKFKRFKLPTSVLSFSDADDDPRDSYFSDSNDS